MTGILKYKKYKLKNKSSKQDGMWYARAVQDRTMEFEDFVEHVSAHNTAYSRGVINGVLLDALDCLKELVLDGKKVRLADLGLFSVGLDTKPAATKEEFTATKNIEGVHLNVLNTKTWSNKELRTRCSIQEFEEYDPDAESGSTTTGE